MISVRDAGDVITEYQSSTGNLAGAAGCALTFVEAGTGRLPTHRSSDPRPRPDGSTVMLSLGEDKTRRPRFEASDSGEGASDGRNSTRFLEGRCDGRRGSDHP